MYSKKQYRIKIRLQTNKQTNKLFSKVSVFSVHIAFSKVFVFKSLRFQSAFSKVSIFAAEQCERKVNTDTFLSVFIGIRSNVNEASIEINILFLL